MGNAYTYTYIILAMVLVVFYFMALAVAVANYIMTSLSWYTIAKQRRVSMAWLAWIPFFNNWVIGGIADKYDEKNGIKRTWRVALIVLSMLVLIMLIIMFVALCKFIIGFGNYEIYYQYYGYEYTEMLIYEMISWIITMYVALFGVAFLSSPLYICQSICSYKIYESTVPEKALKYMLLSLMVPLANGICLIKCKNLGYAKTAPADSGEVYISPDIVLADEPEYERGNSEVNQ